MNKKVFFLISLALLAVVCFIPSILDTRAAWKNPFETELALSYYNYAVRDRNNSLVIIDNGLSRITKLDSQGLVDWTISSQGIRDDFQFLTEAVVDYSGNVYALNQVTKGEGFKTEREELIRIKPNGIFDKALYSKTYTDEQIDNHNITRGRFQNLQITAPYVTWYEMQNKSVVLSRLNLETNKFDQLPIIQDFDGALWISSITHMPTGETAFVAKDGTVQIVNLQGERKVLYNANLLTNGLVSTPWWINVRSTNGHLLVSDLAQRKILEIDPHSDNSQNTTVFFDSDSYKKQTKDEFPYVYYTFSMSSNDYVVTVNDSGVLVISPFGNFESITRAGTFSVTTLINRGLFWLGALIFILILLYFTIKAYSVIFKKRVLLALKQVLFILPLLSVVIAIVIYSLFSGFQKKFQELSYQQISQFIQLLSLNVPVESIEKIKSSKDFMDEDYKAVRSFLHKSINFNKDPWNAHIYFVLYKKDGSNITALMQTNDGVSSQHPYTYLTDPDGNYVKAITNGIVTAESVDAWGSWVFGVGPVYNAKGEVVALIEVGRDMFGFKREYQKIVEDLLPIVIYSIAGLMISFILFTLFLLQPLRALRKGVLEISEGNWGEEIKVKGKDEVSDLTQVFNTMTHNLQTHIDEIVSLSAGYRHFVPQEFLTQLDRDSVTEVKLGDQVQREMTVLFSDIRSFTTISESMSPKENFEFLNRYLGTMGPQIRNSGGFIDKYIGDAIMALFPSRPEDALDASIGIVELLEQFNADQDKLGQPRIAIGLGIHTGLLMLGILGEKERYDGTVISDNVNLASRLEGLTKYFGAAIIVSDKSFEKIENKNKYLSRYLGTIKVKGKKDDVGIYEILNGSEHHSVSQKMAAEPILMAMIEKYKQQDFKACYELAQEALKVSPKDACIKLYAEFAKENYKKPPTGVWSGALIMDSK